MTYDPKKDPLSDEYDASEMSAFGKSIGLDKTFAEARQTSKRAQQLLDRLAAERGRRSRNGGQ